MPTPPARTRSATKPASSTVPAAAFKGVRRACRTAAPAVAPGTIVWATPAAFGDDIASRDGDRLLRGRWFALGGSYAGNLGPVVIAGDAVYAAEAVDDPGRLSFGRHANHRQVLWRCSGLKCDRTTLDRYVRSVDPEAIAISPDGDVSWSRRTASS